MTHHRPPPFFIADSKALDFVNSIACPVDTPVEWLGSGADLVAWLREAELIPVNVPDVLKKRATPGELDAVAAQARALREWFRGFVHAHMGRQLKPNSLQELGPLNRVLARDEEFGQIAARETNWKSKAAKTAEKPVSGLVWSPQRRWNSADSLLLPVARAMADLICEEDFTHIRGCEGKSCVLLFVDRTRAHARRWCSMAICGNRAKQAAHRERRAHN